MHEQAAATGWKQRKLPLSHSGSTQIQSGGDAATRSQHLLSRRSDATRIQPTRDCAYDDINLHTTQTEAITALRVSTTAQCTMPRASSRNWLETMQAPVSTRNDYSNPVRRRCSDSQPTSTQSQVGCNRIQPPRDCAYDDINLHTNQTEAITALRVSTTARCTMPRASRRNWLETMQAPVSTLNDQLRTGQMAMR